MDKERVYLCEGCDEKVKGSIWCKPCYETVFGNGEEITIVCICCSIVFDTDNEFETRCFICSTGCCEYFDTKVFCKDKVKNNVKNR